eukprot:CAMPEP_0202495462 /NCGR_PEP_ID=MMETSP1361-20130828/16552_1 /ASSEMBLY_ACC=CAM_ASM_000849 /TAXON_ID=210615 /ORGANISM="Staurosira complex sp., Strain CCMP2646" /LENGTH=285 /DNA_ID=CAMNT_0049126489 /DNA_START=64 /DNA_END=921 /DNA_ORIENTATION=-
MLNALRNRYQQSLEKKAAALHPRTRADLASEIRSSTLAAVGEVHDIDASIEKAQLALNDLQEKKNFIGLRLASYQEKLTQRRKHLERENVRRSGIQNKEKRNLEEESQSLVGLFQDGFSSGACVSSNFVDQSGQNGTESDSDTNNTNDEGDSDASNRNKGELDLEHLSLDDLREHQMKLERDEEALRKVEKSQLDLEIESNALQKKIFVLSRRRDEILQKTGECRDFLVAAAHIEQETQDDDTVDSNEDLEQGRLSRDQRSSLRDGELITLVNENSDLPNNDTSD